MTSDSYNPYEVGREFKLTDEYYVLGVRTPGCEVILEEGTLLRIVDYNEVLGLVTVEAPLFLLGSLKFRMHTVDLKEYGGIPLRRRPLKW